MSEIKKAPAKKPSQRRLAITIRLKASALKNIERAAAKTKDGARSFIREHLETKFGD